MGDQLKVHKAAFKNNFLINRPYL